MVNDVAVMSLLATKAELEAEVASYRTRYDLHQAEAARCKSEGKARKEQVRQIDEALKMIGKGSGLREAG